jgi:hypothetical protein
MELRLVRVADPAERRSFALLARVLTRAAGPPALLRAIPPFMALMLFAAVIFGGNGMHPRDLCAPAASSLPVRAALWAGWLLLTAPAARALLETPTTFFLRALPVPPWQFWAVHGAHLVALQTPWILLFTSGAGPLTGLAQGLAAAAAAALVVARPVTARELLAVVTLGATLVAGAPPWLTAPVALGSGTVAVAAAWRRAPEASARAGASRVTGSAPVALGLAHAAVLVRRDAVTLLRGGAAALVGAFVLALALRNNRVTDPALREGLVLAAGAIPLSLATAGVGVKLLDTERHLTWLLLSTAASARLRALAAAAVSVAWGGAAGALYGTAAALVAGGEPMSRLRLALLGTALGAVLGGAAAHVARRAEQPSGIDGTFATVGMFAAAVVSALLAAWLGAAALALLAVVALGLVVTTPALLARHERRSEAMVHLPWSGS